MATNRSNILRGPAVITHDGATYYTKDDIKIDIGLETVPVNVAAFGKVDEIVKTRFTKITATPIGAFGNRAKLWPYGSTAIGSSIFGDTDRPLVIWTMNGQKYTFASAALTKMPPINLSATGNICGAAEWTCIGKAATAWSDASSWETTTAVAFAAGGFNTSDIVKSTYSGVWGTVTGFTTITTKSGFSIDFDLSLTPIEVDGEGILDYTLGGLDVTVKFQPMGPTVDNIIDAMKLESGGGVGMSLNTISGGNLVISGDAAGKPRITITKAAIKDAGLMFGLTAERIGDVTMVATRTITSGSASDLFSVDVVPA